MVIHDGNVFAVPNADVYYRLQYHYSPHGAPAKEPLGALGHVG